jgi:hypothetical protein
VPRGDEVEAVHRRHASAALCQLGRINEANKVLRHAVEMSPTHKQFYKRMPPWHRRVDYERFLDGLRKAGLTE